MGVKDTETEQGEITEGVKKKKHHWIQDFPEFVIPAAFFLSSLF